MNYKHLAMPWSRRGELYSAPGRLILKVALGEAPESIPAAPDVRRGLQPAAEKLGHGPIDRLLRQFGGEPRIVRVHTAAATLGLPGAGHRGFDAIEHVTGLARTFRVDLSETCCIADLVDALRQLSMVEQASPQYLCTLPFAAAQPAAIDIQEAWLPRQRINAAEAMAYEPGDGAVIVAIVDTGVLKEHRELEGRLRSGFDTVQLGGGDLASGIQLLGDRDDEDTDPEDEVGHGTACAGIIGALGAEIPPGLVGASGLLPIRVLGSARFPGRSDAVGIGAISDIDAGLKMAIDLGAKVINMSFGTPSSALESGDPLPHADIVHYGLSRGCVLVAASGNSGKPESFLPAAFDGVIAVGAASADGLPADFSTSGPHVALAAPGERVVTAGLHGYQMVTGTSFAAPFVTGAAALLVSRAARRSYPLEGAAVRRILCASAQPWPAGQGQGHGAGVLDAYAALQLLDREIEQTARHGSTRSVIYANSARGP